MHAFSDNAVSQQSLAAPSIATYRAGDTVLSAASTPGRLLILKEGAVTVVKEDVEMAKVTEPDAVLGKLSAWLGQPHTAEVHALEEAKFNIVSTAAPLSTVAERREDSANRAQAELKRQVQDSSITLDKIEELLGASGGNLVYGGYPYDPFVFDTVKH